ncbi:MAG: hypothetical protein MUC49_15870 [Raineya sp.]|jgi:hypothetical protein|nr:hypothetical protein [Raineya sp.]
MPILKNTDKVSSPEDMEKFAKELKKITPKLPPFYAERVIKTDNTVCKTLIYNVKQGRCVNWKILELFKKVIQEYQQELQTQEI